MVNMSIKYQCIKNLFIYNTIDAAVYKTHVYKVQSLGQSRYIQIHEK